MLFDFDKWNGYDIAQFILADTMDHRVVNERLGPANQSNIDEGEIFKNKLQVETN